MTTPPSPQRCILVADDDVQMRALFSEFLTSMGYAVVLAADGLDAMGRVSDGVDLMVLDLVMPGMDGFEVLRRIRTTHSLEELPVLLVTGLDTRDRRIDAVRHGANDFISKPIDFDELRVRLQALIDLKERRERLHGVQRELQENIYKKNDSLLRALSHLEKANQRAEKAQYDTIERLALVAEYRDQHTAEHLNRIRDYTELIARCAGLDEQQVLEIGHASTLHDVGKLAVRREILAKEGSLTAEERKELEQHAEIGANMLSGSDAALLKLGESIAWTHHERWDGTGYPRGLKGEHIPLEGRICAIADVLDALTSLRPYKEPFPLDRSIHLLREGRGTHFDPVLLDAFLERMDEIKAIHQRHKDQVSGGSRPGNDPNPSRPAE